MPEPSEGVCQVSFLCLVTAVRLCQCGIPVKWDRAVGQGMQMDAGDIRQPKRAVSGCGRPAHWNDWAHEMVPPNLLFIKTNKIKLVQILIFRWTLLLLAFMPPSTGWASKTSPLTGRPLPKCSGKFYLNKSTGGVIGVPPVCEIHWPLPHSNGGPGIWYDDWEMSRLPVFSPHPSHFFDSSFSCSLGHSFILMPSSAHFSLLLLTILTDHTIFFSCSSLQKTWYGKRRG